MAKKKKTEIGSNDGTGTATPVTNKRFIPSPMELDYSNFLDEMKKNPEEAAQAAKIGRAAFVKAVMIDNKSDSFMSNFLINLRIIPDMRISTAGVCYQQDSKSFQIMYNPLLPAFFSRFNIINNSNKIDFTNFVVFHEIKHIVYNFFSRKDTVEMFVNPKKLENLSDAEKFYLKNVAHDLSINSILSNILNPFFLKEENRFGHYPGMGSFAEYPPNLSFEEYFNRLLNDDEFMSEMKKNPQFFEFDQHDFLKQLENLSEEEREIVKNELRQQISNAVNKSTSAGNESNVVLKNLSNLIAPPPVDAESVLSYFIEKSVFTNKKPTMKKVNKKVPYILPGKNKYKTSHLALCVDQSGSVDDQLLVRLLQVCEKFLDHTSIDLIPFDCGDINTDKIMKFKSGDKMKFDRVLQGGTDFNKPTDYVNEVGIYDGIIIFTDLQAPMPGPCSIDRMWVSNSDNSNPAIESSGEIVLKFSA